MPAPQPAPNTAEKTALNESPGCMSVGPFGDVENSIRTAALLRERGFDPRQRAEAGGTLREYWVYVGGVKSDDEANRVLRNLQRLGFKDAQVMPDGGDPGRRVSLGLFNDRGGADQRMWAARLKGFQAAGGAFGNWSGLAPDESPLFVRDASIQELYALDWEPH